MKEIRRLFFGVGELALCGDAAVSLGERKWVADEATGFIKFQLSFAFPNVSNYGDGIHASVIARNFQTMADKPVNSNHKMVAYGSDGDTIMGTIVGVEFPATPEGGWKTTLDKASAPYMTGIAALWLNAEPTQNWISRYQDKRKKVAVSMEVLYTIATCGFAVAIPQDKSAYYLEKFAATTPEEFLESGWEYVPLSSLLTPEQMSLDGGELAKAAAKSPKDSLLRTRDFKLKRMIGGSLLGSGLVGKWNGRDVYFLQGGIDGNVFYPGMGIVERGAEPRAGIETMLAEDEESTEVANQLEEIAGIVKAAAQGI